MGKYNVPYSNTDYSGDIVYIKKFPGKPFDPKKSFQRELKGKSATYEGL